LTCNEVQHLFAVQVARPVGITATGCAGRSGDADIKPAPVPATTDHSLLATVKTTIYGWSTDPGISWWRRACGPGPANGGGIP
jgi:hypothetical protein